MIEFQGVSKVFAGHPAVKDLTLELREGAFSVLVGTSGSGKSTTLKMINRLLEPDRGTMPSSPSACFPTGRWRRISPPCRSCKDGRGQGSPTGSTS